MIINIDENFFAQPRCRLLGNKGETMSRRLEVRFPKVENAQFYKLRFLLSDNTTCYELDVTSGEAYVSGSLLVQVGKVLCQWIAVGIRENEQYEVVAKSNVFEMFVDDSIDSGGEPIPTYEETADMFDRAVATLEEVEKIIPQFDELSSLVHSNDDKLTILWAKHDGDFLSLDSRIGDLTRKHDKDVESIKQTIDAEISSLSPLVENSAVPIIQTVYGDSISVTDSAQKPLRGLSVYGKTIQDGTPTPESPVELVNVENPKVSIFNKNLLYNTQKSTTQKGVEITVNNDKSLTFNGTATGDIYFSLSVDTFLKKGRYFLSGTPGGGGLDKYYIYLHPGYYSAVDANGSAFEVTEDTVFTARIYIASGTVCDNLTFRPQIEIGSARTEYEPCRKQSIELPYTLRGVPVMSGGNYTDDSGQQWICDEVDFERGVRIIRTGEIAGYSGQTVGEYISTTGGLSDGARVICSVDPIEAPLTAEQIEAYKALYCYYPKTTIINDDGAGMKISYTADTKTYIDNQFKVLFALISTM